MVNPLLEGQQFTFTVQLQGRLRSVEEFESMVVRTADDGGLIRLRDVGRVSLGGETYGIDAMDLQGVPQWVWRSISFGKQCHPGVGWCEGSVIAEFERTMPVGLNRKSFTTPLTSSTSRSKGVVNSLRDAVILVVLILFLFLQNWKATLVPAIAIPVALIGTFALVLAFGFSLNQLTLFGLVLATGLVVDDAITVVEDTSAKKAEGMTSVEAAMATMDELFSAVIATSLVKMAVFLPVLFFPGATGTIYKQFAATILFSIGISTFNALTFSPMLAALLLSRDTKELSKQQYATAGGCLGFVYGLLSAGGGAALALVPLVVGAVLGLVARQTRSTSLRLPGSVGGAMVGLILAGVSQSDSCRVVHPALAVLAGSSQSSSPPSTVITRPLKSAIPRSWSRC